MKITYTGRQVELAPAHLKKIEERFAKIGKLLDGRRECEAHVIVSLVRRMHRAEATINYYGHQLVGIGSDADLFTALHAAADKLEKQCLKARTKWRDARRTPRTLIPEAEAKTPVEEEPAIEPRIFHVKQHQTQKPLTLEEAMLQMDQSRDYLVYRDSDTDRDSVFLRRRD